KYMDGRYLLLEFEKFILFYVYTPNSGCDKDNYRQMWDNSILNFLSGKKEKPIIYSGDLNVCCSKYDIYDELLLNSDIPGLKSYEINNFKKLQLIDIQRYLNPEKQLYTWWNNKTRDKGMRLDYFLLDGRLIKFVKNTNIHKNIYGS